MPAGRRTTKAPTRFVYLNNRLCSTNSTNNAFASAPEMSGDPLLLKINSTISSSLLPKGYLAFSELESAASIHTNSSSTTFRTSAASALAPKLDSSHQAMPKPSQTLALKTISTHYPLNLKLIKTSSLGILKHSRSLRKQEQPKTSQSTATETIESQFKRPHQRKQRTR